MRILLADDQAAVRAALRRLLKEEPGLSVIVEAANAEDLLAEASAARPDVVFSTGSCPVCTPATKRRSRPGAVRWHP